MSDDRPYTQADDDRIFENRLRYNDVARQVVGAWLEHQGYQVEIKPLQVRPSFADRHAYSDGGDIFAWKDNGPRHRVEAKTTTRPFKTAQQWPYPDMLVCKAADWENADPKPWMYVIVDATLHYGAVLMGSQILPTHRRMQPDRKRHIEYPAYALTPDQFRFVKLR